ncbi:hypothetical protein P167DRAFT_343132 [Morchella conica CCBAS932]|uniref:Uncharacterized protein n=1 Tax=Morchella conica CCBAS932 TaxID=1392247 RepID=A0A3N4KD71_9PEZI|nr:hypothetical protein P167DRAFT_343132 [Morchella conica CCBAS932]
MITAAVSACTNCYISFVARTSASARFRFRSWLFLLSAPTLFYFCSPFSALAATPVLWTYILILLSFSLPRRSSQVVCGLVSC